MDIEVSLMKSFYGEVEAGSLKNHFIMKVEAGSLKNHSVIGSGIAVNTHGRRHRGTGGKLHQSLSWGDSRTAHVYVPPNICETRYTHFIYGIMIM